jgi:hypothetical protein
MSREDRHKKVNTLVKANSSHLRDVDADLQWLMSGQHAEAADDAAAGRTRSSCRASIEHQQNKLSKTRSSLKNDFFQLLRSSAAGDGSRTAQSLAEATRSQQQHSISGSRHSMLADVSPRQSHFDAASRHHATSIAAVAGPQKSCRSVQKGSPIQQPHAIEQSVTHFAAGSSMQRPRTSSIGTMEQECVVTALLQQNDALQKQLQELLAANREQPAPAPAAASPPAAGPAEAEGRTAVQQLTANERRLVKLLKKMQKDKER